MLKVVAGILLQSNKVLIAKRQAGKEFAHFWEFPGGKVQEQEGLEAALARELQEELGINPLEFYFWKVLRHKYSKFEVELYFYIVKKWQGIAEAKEGQVVKWEFVLDLNPEIFLPADRKVIHWLKEEFN